MKKLFLLRLLCLMTLLVVALCACKKDKGEVSGDYVDLGLPSGTKWKTVNEKNAAYAEYDFFTFDEAVAAFGDKLPSREQWMELVNECNCTWTGMGYKVVGSNGKSITLPASGYGSDGSVYNLASEGHYWTSTSSHDGEYAWHLSFKSGNMGLYEYGKPFWDYSVRLVHDK